MYSNAAIWTGKIWANMVSCDRFGLYLTTDMISFTSEAPGVDTCMFLCYT